MKILILSQNLRTLGGVQKVITSILNEIISDKDYDITVIMPKCIDKYNFFTLNNNIKILNEEDFKEKKSFFRKCLHNLNRITGILNFKVFNKINYNLVLSKKERKKYISFINQESFDVVIAAGCRYSIELAIISKNINIS